MDCKTCKEHRREVQPVPYIVHESAMARQERHVKRLIIALVVAIILIFASNAAWLWFFNRYEYVSEGETTSTETVTVDGKDGTANYNVIGADGSIVNGESSCNQSDENEDKTNVAEKEP